MLKICILTVLGVLVYFPAPVSAARKSVEAVREGNAAYEKGDFKKALEEYHIAEADRPETPGIDCNIGNVLYEQGDYEQATERLTKALNSDDVRIEAQAQYNLGNTHFRAKDYQKAIEAFKASLDLNPDDMDAKYNLELARRMLKEQTQSEQSDEDKSEQQEKKEQEQEQQQEQQQQEEQDEQQQQQQQQNQQEDESQKREQQQQQQQQMDQKEMSKEDAERILNALQDDEQDIQKRIQRNKTATGYVGKDW